MNNYRHQLNRLQASYDHAARQVAEERTAFRATKERLADAQAAQTIIQKVAAAVQESAHAQVAGVVSRCLEAIFGEDAYAFRIDFLRKRGRTEAQLVFVRDGEDYMEPLDSAGGGQVDVAAFALRLACLLLTRPRLRLLMVLDEPFRNIHGAAYQARVGALLLTLAKELGVQFIIASNFPWLRVGTVVNLEEETCK